MYNWKATLRNNVRDNKWDLSKPEFQSLILIIITVAIDVFGTQIANLWYSLYIILFCGIESVTCKTSWTLFYTKLSLKWIKYKTLKREWNIFLRFWPNNRPEGYPEMDAYGTFNWRKITNRLYVCRIMVHKLSVIAM